MTGGTSNGTGTQVTYDKAGNRQTVQVTGVPNARPTQRVIVVPLNGFTIIPIDPPIF